MRCKLIVLLALALILRSVECGASCVLENCNSAGAQKSVPPCHRHHSAPAPCSHQILVADTAHVSTPGAKAVQAEIPWTTGSSMLLVSGFDMLVTEVPAPPGLARHSSVVLRI
jgi:hypothetical protein